MQTKIKKNIKHFENLTVMKIGESILVIKLGGIS